MEYSLNFKDNSLSIKEPSEEDIILEIKRNPIYKESDWWYVREYLRLKLNGNPPGNYHYWEDFFRKSNY